MSVCEICGKKYETYPIIICNNPMCFAQFLADEQKEDGSFRRICEDCRNKLYKVKRR